MDEDHKELCDCTSYRYHFNKCTGILSRWQPILDFQADASVHSRIPSQDKTWPISESEEDLVTGEDAVFGDYPSEGDFTEPEEEDIEFSKRGKFID